MTIKEDLRLQATVLEAADDYVLGLQINGFAEEHGGIEELLECLINAVIKYSYPKPESD